jgi:riboflavin kinase/FMN adenylyltransferase
LFITLKNSITSIAIGGFDGMHLAHQELFKQLDTNGALVVIETGYANLTPTIHREKYIDCPIFYYPLQSIKHLEPLEFISLLKQEYPNLKKIVVGFDFKFGVRASGTIDTLCENFSGEVVVIDEYKYKGEAIHSRIIREYLSLGDIKKANIYLNKHYSIIGRVIQGQGLGKKQFVPTLNLEVEDFLIPCTGIYATKTTIKDIKYLSATFIGHRVTTDGEFAVETHVIDENIYIDVSKVEIEFLEKIRENKKFEDYQELQKQILTDINQIKLNFR